MGNQVSDVVAFISGRRSECRVGYSPPGHCEDRRPWKFWVM